MCARGSKLAVEVPELLVGKRRVVVADEKVGLGTVLFDLGLRLRQICTQPLDFPGQPRPCCAGLVLLRSLLEPQIRIGNAIGYLESWGSCDSNSMAMTRVFST